MNLKYIPNYINFTLECTTTTETTTVVDTTTTKTPTVPNTTTTTAVKIETSTRAEGKLCHFHDC